MLTQSNIERERYEARRKAQLDYNSGLADARMDGVAAGEKIGVIHFCEELLQRSKAPTKHLLRKSLEELTRLAEELQTQLLN